DTDPGIATTKDDYSLETYILKTNHYQIELLANLDQVPESAAIVVVSFPKPKPGSGFPARVFAILPWRLACPEARAAASSQPMDVVAELEERLVCGDGGVGTLLLDRGVPVDRCLEELCISEPDRIRAVHEEYIAAGARVIETNTFGANSVRLARFGFEDRVGE